MVIKIILKCKLIELVHFDRKYQVLAYFYYVLCSKLEDYPTYKRPGW